MVVKRTLKRRLKRVVSAEKLCDALAELDGAMQAVRAAHSAVASLTPGGGRGVAIRQGRSHRPSIFERDAELREYVNGRLSDAGAYQHEILAECQERFGDERTPSRSALSSYVVRERERKRQEEAN